MGGKDSFHLLVHHLGKPEQGLKARNEDSDQEEHCLLVFFPAAAPPAFLYNPGHLPRGGTAHSGLGTPTSLVIKKAPHRLAHGSVQWRQFFSWGSLFSANSRFGSSWQLKTRRESSTSKMEHIRLASMVCPFVVSWRHSNPKGWETTKALWVSSIAPQSTKRKPRD